MQTNLFETLNAAGVIDHVTIWKAPGHDGWSVYGYGEDNRDLGVKSQIEAARGGPRTWASLDTAYAWVRSAGWRGDVVIAA